ncbi:MAG: AEC family transporter [Spirochaetaceae bacterium]|nr:AEC family transporter [Spirochaetaceae bacterium]
MAESFSAVSFQVVVLFILIGVGFILTKCRFLTKECVNGLVKIILYSVTPCVIVESFHREFDPDLLRQLGIAVLASFVSHLLNIVLAHLLVREKDKARRCVYQFGIVFTNCGYMALPLQNALLGSDGVFFGAAYIAVFNLLNWTYGIVLLDNEKTKISLSKVFINPGIIGVCVGLFFFLTPFSLPPVLFTPVKLLADLNTPLPMMVIGFYLAGITSFALLKDKNFLTAMILSLIVAPLCSFGVLYLMQIRGPMFVSMIIAAASPVGANTVMFSNMFNKDAEVAGTLVAVSTLFSILTMPLIVAFAIYFM